MKKGLLIGLVLLIVPVGVTQTIDFRVGLGFQEGRASWMCYTLDQLITSELTYPMDADFVKYFSLDMVYKKVVLDLSVVSGKTEGDGIGWDTDRVLEYVLHKGSFVSKTDFIQIYMGLGYRVKEMGSTAVDFLIHYMSFDYPHFMTGGHYYIIKSHVEDFDIEGLNSNYRERGTGVGASVRVTWLEDFLLKIAYTRGMEVTGRGNWNKRSLVFYQYNISDWVNFQAIWNSPSFRGISFWIMYNANYSFLVDEWKESLDYIDGVKSPEGVFVRKNNKFDHGLFVGLKFRIGK